MKTKFVISVFFLVLSGVLFVSATSMEDDPNGKAGYTSSPGESTCTSSNCHNSYVLNSGPGSITITSSNLTNWEYVPGQTYSISVTVAQSGKSLFGMGFEALKSNGDNAGTLVPGTGNQIKSKTVQGFSRKNIVHTQNGGSSANSHTFTFSWTAPSTNVGNVVFYAAGDACNNNGNESGDYVYTISQVVSASVGVFEVEGPHVELNLFPNPSADQLNISFSSPMSGVSEFMLYDSRGALVRSLGKSPIGQETITKNFDVSDLSNGTYMLQLNIDGTLVSSRIFQKM